MDRYGSPLYEQTNQNRRGQGGGRVDEGSTNAV